MQVHAILTFNGRCEEALTFYRQMLDAEVTKMMRWKDSPDPEMRTRAKNNEEKIMHAMFRVGETNLMASDGIDNNCEPGFRGMTLSLEVENDEQARRLFTALAEGGKIQMPLKKVFWTSLSGMLNDRFDVPWMISTAA